MKLLVLSFSVIYFSHCTFSQAQNTSFALKGGLNIASVSGLDNNRSRADFLLGFAANRHFTSGFSLQPEIYYSNQGAMFKDSEVELKYQYLNMPLLLKMHFSKLHVFFGPQIGLLITAKEKNNSETTDVTASIDNIDASAAIGFGLSVSQHLSFDLRYIHGVHDIRKNYNKTGRALYHKVFQLNIFYSIGKGK
ncbi:hypothetical protein C900_05691 [Fulvivirga imtechensis AK7]|uniref:Outer membrane protein beta-barrel domain-containing protein n=1 Tax=Fulvivirga imtechensis AK7 TaxID=1237149 RepID=L8JJ90_9BACT|nr:porin family protein [Fulvivirga imtechensis]ELR68865.1 hypothetical protein C900_05691 [Fulvivirga imtechensis AK7]